MKDQPFRVVIADDVSALRMLIRIVLQDSGRFVVVGEAADGEEAVARARELQPDLVLLDLSMPRMDGLEALPNVIVAAPHCKVVVFSGFTADRMATLTMDAGAVHYIEKGASPGELVSKLLAVLEPSHAMHAPGGRG